MTHPLLVVGYVMLVVVDERFRHDDATIELGRRRIAEIRAQLGQVPEPDSSASRERTDPAVIEAMKRDLEVAAERAEMLATIERVEADNARLRRELDALRNGQLSTGDRDADLTNPSVGQSDVADIPPL